MTWVAECLPRQGRTLPNWWKTGRGCWAKGDTVGRGVIIAWDHQCVNATLLAKAIQHVKGLLLPGVYDVQTLGK